jgi:hypothetical protein
MYLGLFGARSVSGICEWGNPCTKKEVWLSRDISD